MNTFEDLIGPRLVFGIPGPRPTAADLRLFRETRAGGLILYRINYRSPRQIRALIREMEEKLGRRLLVTADHEGGRVVMFGGGVTVFPDNLAFGAAARPSDTARQGAIEARELRRLGVDAAFSPTVDVLTAAHSPNIGIRAYGRDPARVAALAVARLRALQARGVSACVKHFPGLGPATLDPHLDLPVIRTTWREARRHHLPPFRACIDAGVDIVMSSHPLYPRLDPRPRTPATFSRRLITDLLRKELGFRGVVASDDLEMGALRRLATPGRAAVLAALAGHDLILCCHRPSAQRDVFRTLVEAARTGVLRRSDLETSLERVRALRGWRGARFAPGSPTPDPAGAALADRVARRAVTLAGPPPRRLGPRERPLLVFPRFAPLARRIVIEPEIARPGALLRRAAAPFRAEVLLTGIDPSSADRARARRAAARADAVVFFCYDGHLHPGNRRLFSELRAAASDLRVVLLRNPYDADWIGPNVPTATAYGFRRCQVAACVPRALGF